MWKRKKKLNINKKKKKEWSTQFYSKSIEIDQISKFRLTKEYFAYKKLHKKIITHARWFQNILSNPEFTSVCACHEKGSFKPHFEEFSMYGMKINHWSRNAAMTDITRDYNFII